jgi:hypothetical protein
VCFAAVHELAILRATAERWPDIELLRVERECLGAPGSDAATEKRVDAPRAVPADHGEGAPGERFGRQRRWCSRRMRGEASDGTFVAENAFARHG